MEDLEHKAFLLSWLCKFFICKSSVAMVDEFSYYVSSILTHYYLNLGALYLSLLYKSLLTMIHWLNNKGDIRTMFSPFWFLQL